MLIKSLRKANNNNTKKNWLSFCLKRNLAQLLIPEMPIAGVSVEERALKFLLFDKNPQNIKNFVYFPLKPGIIEEGILKKPQELKLLVQSLRKKIKSKAKKIFIILTLPSSNFYINLFRLPALEEKMLEEAIIFNLQTNAPLPLEEAYYDWEISAENDKGEVEIFSALGIKNNINSYLEIFESSDFKAVAVEPYCLSLGRSLTFLSKEFREKNFLVIDFKLEGMEFMLFEKGQLIYFDFDSWLEIFPSGIPKNIEISHLQDHLKREIPPLLNYFPLKRNQKIDYFSFFYFDSRFFSPLLSFLKNNYQIKEFYFNPSLYFPKPINETFLGLIGSALRGLVPRAKDVFVSLSPLQTEESYILNRTTRIVSLWSKMFISILGFFFVIFLLIDKLYLLKVEKNFKNPLFSFQESLILKKEREMIQKVEEFNKLVDDINTILGYQLRIDEILTLLIEKAKDFNVNIKKIIISGYPSKNFTFQGVMNNKEKVFDFVNILKDTGKFENISLPFSNITEISEGVSFYLNGNFK